MSLRLFLEITGFRDAARWDWRLTEPEGAFVADHQVSLDPSDFEHAGFRDLDSFLRDPATAATGEQEDTVARVGRWIGDHVLGPIGPAIAARAPVTVHVQVPKGAEALLYRPLELAHVGGRPLALQEVSLVFEPQGCARRPRHPVGRRLRMLALFSVPTDVAGLAVRRERYELSRFVERIVARDNRAVELRVLQYGVTRDGLREVLQDGDGWDIVHFSGHGLAGGLVLETDDGARDVIDTADLLPLLLPVREQLKLVTLSSCLSAASLAAHTLRALGFDDRLAEREERRFEGIPVPAIATQLAQQLGCAVLAMRFPVDDDFAISLSRGLYDRLLSKGHSLPRALQLALLDAIRLPPRPGFSTLSVATPALFGRLAAELRLEPPSGQPLVFDRARLRAAGLPAEPERFVGRVGPLARAARALATGSGRSGVLIHGAPGLGKTACALELAYRHRDSFKALVWHRLPDERADISGALAALARALETSVPGLRLADLVDSRERLEAFLPELAEFLEREAVLLVLDNLESLLTDAGQWRDQRWASLLRALTGHRGQSRLVLTSRRLPAALDPSVQVERLVALSLAESALLARELEGLGSLIASRAGTAGRDLVRRTLELTAGDPGLLELAGASAAHDSELLGRRLRAVEAGASREELLALLATVGPQDSRARAPAFRTDLARARELVAELRSLHERDAGARRRAQDRIREPAGLLDLPDAAPTLARRLAELESRTGDDDWHTSRAALDAWLSDAEGALGKLRGALAANEAPLRHRDRLRGRLDGQKAMAKTLGLLEDPELSALAGRATELLFTAPTDLRQAETAVLDHRAALEQHNRWEDAGGDQGG